MNDIGKKPFRIRKYSSKGFDLFKAKPLHFIGAFLLYLVIGSVIVNLAGGRSSFLFNLVNTALYAGITVMAHRIYEDENVKLSHAFWGLKKIVPFIIYSLIYHVFMFGVALLLFGNVIIQFLFLSTSDENLLMPLITITGALLGLAMVVVFILVFVATFYVSCFILFEDLDAISAIKASFNLAMKNPGKIFLFYLFWLIIIIISLIPLGLGLLISVPSFMASSYVAWRDQSGFMSEERIVYSDSLVD